MTFTPEIDDQFGRRVRQERELRGWSQSELATRLMPFGVHLHFSAIAKMEARDVKAPRGFRLVEACALSEVFEVPLHHLLEAPGNAGPQCSFADGVAAERSRLLELLTGGQR